MKEINVAEVFQIVATNTEDRHFEPDLVLSGAWHAATSAGAGIRTICGIQLEGDDGYSGGPTKQGRVTCNRCRALIADIQAIKNWK